MHRSLLPKQEKFGVILNVRLIWEDIHTKWNFSHMPTCRIPHAFVCILTASAVQYYKHYSLIHKCLAIYIMRIYLETVRKSCENEF
jgi:hypothetical protein